MCLFNFINILPLENKVEIKQLKHTAEKEYMKRITIRTVMSVSGMTANA